MRVEVDAGRLLPNRKWSTRNRLGWKHLRIYQRLEVVNASSSQAMRHNRLCVELHTAVDEADSWADVDEPTKCHRHRLRWTSNQQGQAVTS